MSEVKVKEGLQPSRALLAVILMLGLAMLLPDRHGVSTLAETNTGVRVWAAQSWVHYDTWSLDPVLCRIHPDYTPLDLSIRDGSPELQKAPGLSWLAVPVYAVFSAGRGGERIPTHRAATALAVVCVWLPLLLIAWCFGKWLLQRFEADAALTALIALMAGSPLFVYSGLFMDYGLSTMLLLGGALAIRSQSVWWIALGGFSLGFAGDVNYMCWFHGAAIGAVELARRVRISDGVSTYLKGVFAGVSIPLFGLMVYSEVMWGSPLATGYDFMDHELHRSRSVPDSPLEMLMRALFADSKHGMWVHAPWTFFGMFGLVLAAREERRRWIAITGLVVLGGCLIFTSFWQAEFKDDAAFARHMLPAYPWLALGLAVMIEWVARLSTARSVLVRGIIDGGIVIGAFYALATAWTFPYHPLDLDAPLWQLSVKLFLLDVHIPPIGSPMDGGAPGAARGHWIPVLVSILCILGSFACARYFGRTRRNRSLVAALRRGAVAGMTAVLFFVLCFQMQPLTDMERLALIEGGDVQLTESDRDLMAAAKREDEWTRRIAREVLESHVTRDDATWSDAGYPETSRWCGR